MFWHDTNQSPNPRQKFSLVLEREPIFHIFLLSPSPAVTSSTKRNCQGWEGSYCVTQLKLDTVEKLSSTIFCLWVCQASVTPDQISTFSNIYRHTSPLLTMYHLIPSSTNLYWPSTSQYRHILTQYHQVPLIIHHLVRHSSVNWIISLFTTHLMSHAQYTWSSYLGFILLFVVFDTWQTWQKRETWQTNCKTCIGVH